MSSGTAIPRVSMDIRRPDTLSEREVQAGYDEIYRSIGLSDPPSAYRRILRLLRPQPGTALLDVACGEGLLLQAAAAAGLRTAGLDLSPVAIARARRNAPSTQLVVGSGEQLPWPDATFDYVTNLGSLEHFRDMGAGLRELVRVLKPAGRVCLILPNSYSLGDVLRVAWMGDVGPPMSPIERSATRKQWQALVEAHGLRIDRTLPYFTPLQLFEEGTWKLRSLRKFLWRGFLQRITPLNLCQEFIFLAHRNS